MARMGGVLRIRIPSALRLLTAGLVAQGFDARGHIPNDESSLPSLDSGTGVCHP